MLDQATLSKLRSKPWRMDNLYKVLTVKKDHEKTQEDLELEAATGKVAQRSVQFRRNNVQRYLDTVPHPRKLIPKARQLGITTGASIDTLDSAMFVRGHKSAIIANNGKLVTELFNSKVRYPFTNPALPNILNFEGAFPPKRMTLSELEFTHDSSVSVITAATGRSLNKMHISELGKLDLDYPDRAKDLIQTSLPALPAGADVTIESTADAGPKGEFFRLCSEAAEMQKAGIPAGPDDFMMIFFGWYLDPDYRIEETLRPIPKELNEYFKELEQKYGIFLDQAQKNFYCSKWRTLRGAVFRQFPSTWEECFRMSQEGVIYADEMGQMDLDRRIDWIPIRSELPVDTWWDLGISRSDQCIILFTQTYPNGTIAIVDYVEGALKGMAHYAKILQDKNYHYGFHTAPWDIVKKAPNSTGHLISQWRVAANLGIRFQIAPKMNISDGIESVRNMFPRFVIDRQRCEKLIQRMRNYRYEFDEDKMIFVRDPVHDINSHACDAVRVMGTRHDTLMAKRALAGKPKKNTGTSNGMMAALT